MNVVKKILLPKLGNDKETKLDSNLIVVNNEPLVNYVLKQIEINPILESGGINSYGGTDLVNSKRVRTIYFKVMPNKKYEVNAKADYNFYAYAYKEDKTFIEPITPGWNPVPGEFTTPEETEYVRIMLKKTTDLDITPNDVFGISIKMKQVRENNVSKII